jgi:oligopeptide/dipeptide ABC transporter ATP-binding protein
MTLVEATELNKDFRSESGLIGRRVVHAIADVSLTINESETLACVGESGSGKSTLGRLRLRLIEPDTGTVSFDGVDVTALGTRQLRSLRRRMQMVFQDPYSSLDPQRPVGLSVAEPLRIHEGLGGAELRDRSNVLLARVGLAEYADCLPYELSGGQLQRVAIARAISTEPRLIVCDEPVAALDVSIRAQVINLLHDLQQERGIAYLFISHDLSLVRIIANRIAVMYRGRIVELAETAPIFENPRHPYTRALLSAIPVADPRRRRDRTVPQLVRSDGRVSVGCAFAPRCPLAIDRCWAERPLLEPLADQPTALVACHLARADRSRQPSGSTES